MPEQMHATVITTDAPPGTQPLSWDEVRRRFDAEKWYWLATAGRDGRAHMRPVLAVCLADKVYSTTSPGAHAHGWLGAVSTAIDTASKSATRCLPL